jgi:hypothetical protein
VNRRVNYTPDKLRSIQTKKINMIRLGRANILFRADDNNNDEEMEEEEVIHKHTYPAID